MMKTPLFSCVVPVKGARPFMDEAMESLRMQGMGGELEIIVQDGDVESDRGQSDALNRGFAKARGEWLFWLNADDVLLPGALRRVGEAMGGGVDWISGNLVYLDEKGRVIKCAAERGWKFAYEGLPARVYGPSSFFRRELFVRAGGFDLGCRFSMDTELWSRFRRMGYWPKKVASYLWGFRMHAGSLTSGDLVGRTPEGMEAEGRAIDVRYGLVRGGLRKRRLQVVRALDGSYARSVIDTVRFRGKGWREIA